MRESNHPEIPDDLPMSRYYVPTLAELIDRLSIVQLKAIYIPENKKAYDQEINLILQDIEKIICEEKKITLGAHAIRAIIVLSIANRVIWENESIARAGGKEAEGRLRFTHSINGCRNNAKNFISQGVGDRQDFKIDALAADLPPELGNWRIWE